MKETYKAPVLEIIEFDTEDIITTSLPGNGGAQDRWGDAGNGGALN